MSSPRALSAIAALALVCGCSGGSSFTPIVSLSGAVYDRNGLPDSLVWVQFDGGPMAMHEVPSVRTDAAGRFSVSTLRQEYLVYARDDSAFVAVTRTRAPNGSLVLRLDRPGVFRGVVSPGSTGTAATLVLPMARWGEEVLADSLGAYEIHGVPPGRWTVNFMHMDLYNQGQTMVGSVAATMTGPADTVTIPQVQLIPVEVSATAARYTP